MKRNLTTLLAAILLATWALLGSNVLGATIRLSGTNNAVTFRSGNVYEGGGLWNVVPLNTLPPPGGLVKFEGGRWYVWQEGAKLTGECKFEGGAQNVTVRGFTGDNAALALPDGSHRRNITIEDNVLTGSPANYFGGNNNSILIAGSSDDVTVRRNLIREGGYGLIGYTVNRLRIEFNEFRNREQGIHLIGVYDDCYVGSNRFVGMVRMGGEFQRSDGQKLTNTFARNFTVEKNVVYGWRKVFNDSEGFSVCVDGGINTRVLDNHIDGVPQTIEGPWAKTEPLSRRSGYGIEMSSRSGEVKRNVVAGNFAGHVVVAGGPVNGGNPTIYVQENEFYGDASVDWYRSQGPYKFVYAENGAPNIVDSGNVKESNLARRPSIPGLPGSTPPPPDPHVPVNVQFADVTDTGAVVTWQYAGDDAEGYTVTFMPNDPADAVRVIVPAGHPLSVPFTHGRPNWVWDVTVTVRTPTGQRTSDPVQMRNAPKPATQPATKPATQPAQNPDEVILQIPPATQPSRYRKAA